MVVLQQNHPRFQQIVAVVSFICIAAALKQIGGGRWLEQRWGQVVALIGLMCSVACLALISNISHAEAEYERTQLSELKEHLQQIPRDSRVVGINIMPHNPFSYVIQPREMLFIRTDMLEQVEIDRAVALFNPDFFLSRDDSVIKNVSKVSEWDNEMYGRMMLFRTDEK